ncbi:MAG: hypothetical protein IAI50_10835, partial [Candidatus Eremiobacteraeota bacterium]|nr:hypothetical protein [Candidatus Eremiobacteraeota bacterium]
MMGMTVDRRFAILAALPLACGCAAAATRAAELPHVPPGFTVAVIAHVPRARELVVAPDGDLIVGTNGRDVYIVADAGGKPATPRVFTTVADRDAAGVALGG